MKGKRCFWTFIGIGMLLMGLVTSCDSSRSLAVDSPLETPGAGDMTRMTDEKAVLAIDLGWGNPQATPLPYRGVGLDEPRHIVPTMQDEEPIVSLVPIGITDDLVIANALFTPPPRTVEEVPEVLEHARGSLVTVDLMSGQVRMLRENIGGHSTDGQYVVWQASQTIDDQYIAQVHVYDLQQDHEFQLGERSCNQPDVSDGVVVWQESRGEGWHIYGQVLASKHEFIVADWSRSFAVPHISGEWVIYLQVGNGAASLHAHNIETQEDLALGMVPHENNAFAGRFHAIGSGWVAWIEKETRQMHTYNLDTRQEQILTELPAGCDRPGAPMLSGDTLVFGCHNQLMGYDLNRDVLFSIPLFPPGDQESTLNSGIILSGDRLVWSLTLDGEQRIYTAQIVRE